MSFGSASPVFWNGAVAQLGERLLCKQDVVGSIPSGSTKLRCLWQLRLARPAPDTNHHTSQIREQVWLS